MAVLKAGFDGCVVVVVTGLEGHDGEVVVGEITLRVELHGFAVPLLRSGHVVFART